MDEEVDVFVDALHSFRIGHEIRRKIAPIKAHPLNEVEGRFQTFSFLNRDDALFSYLVHGLGKNVTDGLVIVRRDRPYLRNLISVTGGFRH